MKNIRPRTPMDQIFLENFRKKVPADWLEKMLNRFLTGEECTYYGTNHYDLFYEQGKNSWMVRFRIDLASQMIFCEGREKGSPQNIIVTALDLRTRKEVPYYLKYDVSKSSGKTRKTIVLQVIGDTCNTTDTYAFWILNKFTFDDSTDKVSVLIKLYAMLYVVVTDISFEQRGMLDTSVVAIVKLMRHVREFTKASVKKCTFCCVDGDYSADSTVFFNDGNSTYFGGRMTEQGKLEGFKVSYCKQLGWTADYKDDAVEFSLSEKDGVRVKFQYPDGIYNVYNISEVLESFAMRSSKDEESVNMLFQMLNNGLISAQDAKIEKADTYTEIKFPHMKNPEEIPLVLALAHYVKDLF